MDVLQFCCFFSSQIATAAVQAFTGATAAVQAARQQQQDAYPAEPPPAGNDNSAPTMQNDVLKTVTQLLQQSQEVETLFMLVPVVIIC